MCSPAINSVLQAIAQSRHDLHRHHASSRPLSEDYELVGLAGEWAFANMFGTGVDLAARPGGDKGKDFTLRVGLRVQVYTRLLGADAPAPAPGESASDVAILASYDPVTGYATLDGWTSGLRVQEVRENAGSLLPMAALWGKLGIDPTLCTAAPCLRDVPPDQEVARIAGLLEVGRMLGQHPRLASAERGGPDFIAWADCSVDVKTARKAANLIHEVNKPMADIYVLARYDDATQQATLLGWTWGKALKAAPTNTFGHRVVNHYIPLARLEAMSSLQERTRPPLSS